MLMSLLIIYSLFSLNFISKSSHTLMIKLYINNNDIFVISSTVIRIITFPNNLVLLNFSIIKLQIDI